MADFSYNEASMHEWPESEIGCKYFTTTVSMGGVSTQVLNYAIRMTREEFEITNNPRSFNHLKETYSILGIHAPNCFFQFANAEAAGEYALFSFRAPNGWTPVSKLASPVSPELALNIFRELVNLIYEYSCCDFNKAQYHPLLCICKESVFVNFNENNKIQIRLLPMLYDVHTYYPGLPREVLCGNGNISSDLYMASYLYLSLRYPNNDSFVEDKFSTFDLYAERCLSPFKNRRYQITELVAKLNSIPDAEAEFSVQPDRDDGVIFVQEDQEETESYSYTPKRKNTDFFDKIIQKKKSGIAKAKNFGKKISNVRDKFDEAFSTEEGDDNDEDS